MRIKNTNKATRRLHDGRYMDHGYDAVFDEEYDEFNVANVQHKVGKALVESYPNIDTFEEEEDEE